MFRKQVGKRRPESNFHPLKIKPFPFVRNKPFPFVRNPKGFYKPFPFVRNPKGCGRAGGARGGGSCGGEVMVAIFYSFGLFCEVASSLLSLQKPPRTALNLFQTEVKYGK